MEDFEHIGVVSGLLDLVNFLAACRVWSRERVPSKPKITAILFGHEASLPERLRSEFEFTIRRAFPYVDLEIIPPSCLNGNRFDESDASIGIDLKSASRRIVYGNAIHKKLHREFFKYLNPDEFVFFDNGLSSYADHPTDVATEFVKLDIPFPSLACYSLAPPLPIPDYLKSISNYDLTHNDFSSLFECLRRVDAQALPHDCLPSRVVIGTSLFRTKRIRWEEERAIYLKLFAKLREEEDSRILFKAHPRASNRPLIGPGDGVDVVDNSIPVEAFAKPDEKGVVYSISSTSLLTMEKYFGWRAYRIETEATRALLADSPHLSKVKEVESISLSMA